MKKLLIISFSVAGLLLLINPPFGADAKVPQGKGSAISHRLFDGVLSTYVDSLGRVDYAALQANPDSLDRYLQLLSDNPPGLQWSRDEQLAYWINAYNAFTLKVILDHYPLASIKDLNPTVYIPFFRSVWQEQFFRIGGQAFSLDRIEHGILRARFHEPRIHFAINCASESCPQLRNEAFFADQLESQLSDQARAFLRDKKRNIISRDSAKLSRIFLWFGGDFTQNGSLIGYINGYAPVGIRDDAQLEYLDYDWRLNDSGAGR